MPNIFQQILRNSAGGTPLDNAAESEIPHCEIQAIHPLSFKKLHNKVISGMEASWPAGYGKGGGRGWNPVIARYLASII